MTNNPDMQPTAANDTIADEIAAAVRRSDVGGRSFAIMTKEIGGRSYVVMPLDTYKEDVERPKRKVRELTAELERHRSQETARSADVGREALEKRIATLREGIKFARFQLDDGQANCVFYNLGVLLGRDEEAALTTPPADDGGLRSALEEAYRKGATDVHTYWQNNPGEPPQGDPEFGEAASDYAAAALDMFDSSASLTPSYGEGL